MAKNILKCGINRVWIDPDAIEELEDAVTRSDIKRLIKDGIIKAKKKIGISSGRKKEKKKSRKKGRGRGVGSRVSAKYAKIPRKRRWIQKVRAQRKLLLEMKNTGKIDSRTYRKLYTAVSSNVFKDKAHLQMYINEIKK